MNNEQLRFTVSFFSKFCVYGCLMAIIVLATGYAAPGQSFTFMTFNIRYDNPDDGPDHWKHRKEDMAGFIAEKDPVIFGIQEGLLHQVQYLDQWLSDYQYIGVGREDGMTKGEYCAIFYQTEKVRLLNSDTFWLSETPGEISVGWDAALPRICTYGLFEDVRSGKNFWVFNTHFDHRGVSARTNSASLLTDQIKSINSQQLPVILMGDFNATIEEKPIQIIKSQLKDCQDISSKPLKGPAGTVNGFTEVQSRIIDFIFCSGFSVYSIEHVVARTSEGRHLSDHLPVVVESSLNN